jgi:protoheme ferro-lyase
MPVPGVGPTICGPWGTDPKLSERKKGEHQQALERKWDALSTDERSRELAMLYGQALIEDATHEERRKIDSAVHRLFYPEVTEDETSVASVEVEAP